MLQEFRQNETYEELWSSDPVVLSKVTAPVLVLGGQETLQKTLWVDSEQHIAQHVANPRVWEPLPRLGRTAPMVAPEPVALELISFFESAGRPD